MEERGSILPPDLTHLPRLSLHPGVGSLRLGPHPWVLTAMFPAGLSTPDQTHCAEMNSSKIDILDGEPGRRGEGNPQTGPWEALLSLGGPARAEAVGGRVGEMELGCKLMLPSIPTPTSLY